MATKEKQICRIDITKWSLPLVAPFRVATRTSHVAHNVLVQIEASDGVHGIGSAAPVEYITGETQESVIASLTSLAQELIGQPIDRLLPLIDKIEQFLPNQPSARAGIEMAVYDLWAKNWNIPLWQHFGGQELTLTTDITIPIVSPEEARALTLESIAHGFDIFKIKIGGSEGHEIDLARIAAVAETAPGRSLRIDANQAFAPDDAVKFVNTAVAISPHIQLIEQPVAKEDVLGLKYVKEHITLPVFADESARSYNEVKNLIRLEAVDGVNIKLMKSGVRESSEIAMLCKRNGIALMVGCMLESPLGIAAATAIAAGIGGFNFIDLDSHKLLKSVECLVGGFTLDGPWLCPDIESPGWGLSLAEIAAGTQH